MSNFEKPALGIAYAITAAFMFAMMGASVKLMPPGIPTGQVLFFRALVSIVILLPRVRHPYSRLVKHEALSIWGRSLFGAAGVGLYFEALRLTSLANATFMADCAPVFVALAMLALYRRVPGRLEVLGLALAVSGGYFLRGESRLSHSPMAMVFGYGSACCAAGAYLALSKAVKDFSAAEIVWCLSITLALASAAISSYAWVIPGPEHGLPLIGIALTSASAQLLTTKGYQHLHPMLAAALGLTAGLWGAMFDVAAFGQSISLNEGWSYGLTVLGILVINFAFVAQQDRAPRVT